MPNLEKVVNVCKRGDVFCKGPLLHTVQMSRIFDDSKTFVDMKMRHPPQKILQKFETFMSENLEKPTDDQVKQFVLDNFEKSDVEFTNWHPEDWKETPNFLNEISNNEYREFAYALHKLWKDLGRKISSKAEAEIDRSSLIWVPNPIIVPGGRFREFYYWDTYWIIRGLLISEMYQTTKGMLDNFLHIVDTYGYIPNGGRIYYLGRSQPPTLILSFKAYMDVVEDLEYLERSINVLEKEFDFWMKKRTKLVKCGDKEYLLATYGNSSEGPRPESYVEDVGLALHLEEDASKASFYTELKAACESGMDFTSRWYVSNGTSKKSLQQIKTSSIIPVDLNAILYRNAVTLSEFHKQLQNFEKADYYRGIADMWLEAVNAVLWHEDVGIWLDFDLNNEMRRDSFYVSNLTPLWTGCYDKNTDCRKIDMALDYLEGNGIFDYPGGVPQSLDPTGEQWDYPNAWPPSQHMLIFGLKKTNNTKAQKVAENLARKWLTTNHQTYLKMHHMAEKYDASSVGHSGGGGEYKVQFGFGWTNGVILDILVNFFSDS